MNIKPTTQLGNLRVEKDTKDRLKKLAKKHNVTLSEIVREVLKRFVESE